MALGAQLLREWKRSLECYHLCMVSKAWCLSRAAGSKVVEFLCDRKALLVGRRDGTIIYMTRRLDAILGSVTMHNGGGVWRIATHKCADYVAVAMGNGELRLLDFRTGAPIVAASFMPLQGRRVVSMAFLPDGVSLMVGGSDGSIGCVFPFRGHSTSPICRLCDSALWDMMALGDSYELVACAGHGWLHRFRFYDGEPQEVESVLLSKVGEEVWCLANVSITGEIAMGCDRQIVFYSVEAHAITRRIMLPGREAAVWTLSYDCSFHRLFVGRANGVQSLICELHGEGLYENDDYYAATVACSLYLDDVKSFVYGDNRGSVYAVGDRRPAKKGSCAISSVCRENVHIPWECCLWQEGNDAVRVSQLYEIWCLCEVTAQE